uniref:Uncharacterized protein n=1 Tax=Prymnesium polylepis TaxID=72548 RepID=A0A7S4KKR5_9EUKA|mmetsp:Transcript_9690/g.23497  ORF Transcript_9690/g.23497 Transcript_9690/m.23497 type:complete len:110 (+) Transcript_9690:736-1065(+)
MAAAPEGVPLYLHPDPHLAAARRIAPLFGRCSSHPTPTLIWQIPEESLADENEMLKALGEQAHALTAHSVVHVGAKAALAAMHKHSSKLDLHKAHGEEVRTHTARFRLG